MLPALERLAAARPRRRRASSCPAGAAASGATPRCCGRSTARRWPGCASRSSPSSRRRSPASCRVARHRPRRARARWLARRDRAAAGRAAPRLGPRSQILPARVADYRRRDLDELCAAGEVVWRGVEALGPNDGRIALLPGRQLRAARAAAREPAEGELAQRDLASCCERRGALFFADLAAETGAFPNDVARGAVGAGVGGRGHQRHARAAALARRQSPSARGSQRVRGRPVRGRAGSGRPAARALVAARRVRARRHGDGTARTALAQALLERYGVLTREAVARRRAQRRLLAPSTRCSRRWRKPAACAAATSSPASARRSSRTPAPTTACARCASRATGAERSCSRRHRSREPLRRGAALARRRDSRPARSARRARDPPRRALARLSRPLRIAAC